MHFLGFVIHPWCAERHDPSVTTGYYRCRPHRVWKQEAVRQGGSVGEERRWRPGFKTWVLLLLLLFLTSSLHACFPPSQSWLHSDSLRILNTILVSKLRPRHNIPESLGHGKTSLRVILMSSSWDWGSLFYFTSVMRLKILLERNKDATSYLTIASPGNLLIMLHLKPDCEITVWWIIRNNSIHIFFRWWKPCTAGSQSRLGSDVCVHFWPFLPSSQCGLLRPLS